MRFLLCLLLSWTALATDLAVARADLTPSQPAPARAPSRHADIISYVIGNRSRMIQITTIAFALGLAILMTATRKH